MKRLGICGHFGIGQTLLNGQTIKTKILTNELKKQWNGKPIMIVDSHGGWKSVPRIFLQSLLLFKNCEDIIIMPAHKGLCILTPLYSFYNLLFHRRIHYVVIGGWLDAFITSHRWLTMMLKKFHGIYVETSTMKKKLEEKGFHNITILPNCKNLSILKPEECNVFHNKPYHLCTFSRVIKEKGIEDAIEAVHHVNGQAGEIFYDLDIYGPVDPKYRERFTKIQENFPEYIRYKGEIPFDQSTDTIKDYFALLFPTRFYTEGIPGTIIDAYAAGVPVIASMWESFLDVVEPDVTGIGYEIFHNEQLEDILLYVAGHPEKLINMKEACLKKAEEFLPEKAVKQFLNSLYEQAHLL